MTAKIELSHPGKKSRRRLVLQKEDREDEEKNNLEDFSHFKVVLHKNLTNIDEIFQNIKINVDLSGFKFIKFEISN